MVDMIAIKSFPYATRRLVAEDAFTVHSRGDARALVALGKARYATTDGMPKVEKADKPRKRRKKAKASK